MSTEIADAYIALYVKMPGVKSDITNAIGGADVRAGVTSSGTTVGNVLSGAIGGAVVLGLQKAISTVTESIGAAISRVDTIRQFPRVMANLGYSADDAAASISSMSTRLMGLPTSLDAMAGMVQQLAPLTGSLSEATELSLAFNNALLAGGKSTDLQRNAMEQYTQMLSIGKVDMMAWRSMVSAMPGQMNQLAISLLGAGANAMDLYAKMQDGTIGFDEFNAAVLRLNSEGSGAFASFEQQARGATEGIATGQANLNTAITRGLANLIDRFQPQIIGLLDSARGFVNETFKVLGDAAAWIGENFGSTISAIATGSGPALVSTLQGIVAAGLAVIGWVQDNVTWLGPLAVAVATVVLGYKAWQIVTGIVTAAQVAYAAATYGAVGATYASETATKAQAIAAKLGAAAMAIQQSAIVRSMVAWQANTAAVLANTSLTNGTKAAIIASSVVTGIATAAQWAWNAALSANPIGVIILAIAALVAGLIWFFTQTELGQQIWETVTTAIGAAMTWLWESVIKPVIDFIAAAWDWLYNNIILPVVMGIMLYIGLWAAIFTWLWETILAPVFAAIGAVFAWIWGNVIQPIIDYIVLAVKVWGLIFEWLYANVVQPVFAAVAAAFTWIWETIIRPVAEFIGGAIRTVGDTVRSIFGGIADFIGSAFQSVLSVVRGPINALIDLINNVIAGLNTVKVDIPDWVPMVGGQTFGLNLPKIPRLAQGAYVTSRAGGVLANIGEGAYDEVVQPTDGPKFDRFTSDIADKVGSGEVELGERSLEALATLIVARTRVLARQEVEA